VTVDQIQIGKRDESGDAGLDITLSAFYRAVPDSAAERP